MNIKNKKIVTHVSVHTLTFHETQYPPPPPGNPWTIQYFILGRATNVELLKQVKNWQSPSRDPWSNCAINSWETTQGQTNYFSGRQKDNSKTILLPRRVMEIFSQTGIFLVLGTTLCEISRSLFPSKKDLSTSEQSLRCRFPQLLPT